MNLLRFTGEMESDDDKPVFGQHNSGNSGSIPKLRIMNKNMAPPEENKFRMVLELTGAASGDDRPGVDIVAILDVCGSMKEERLGKLKTAMKILLRKLRPVDRLSIITFSRQRMFAKTTQLQTYPLHSMSKVDIREETERIVNALQHVADVPSIVAALRKALDVLAARNDANGRSAAIVIMSDGDPWRDHGDTTSLHLADVPLYKFSFAHEYKSDGLHFIGNGGNGGTFPLGDVDDLSMAFSQCLAELCEIVVEDLELTFTPVRSDDEEMIAVIEKVYAGNCQQSRDDTTGSVTVSMNGQLYSGEIRRFIADVLLPAVSKQMTTNVLQITHSYTIGGERFSGLPLSFNVIRTGKPSALGNAVENIERKNTGNMLDIKQGLGVLKGALGVFETSNIKKKTQQPQTYEALDGEKRDVTTTDDDKVLLNETNSEGSTPSTDRLQGAKEYVAKQALGASKYVIEQGGKVFEGQKLPDSNDLKGAGKNLLEHGQIASKQAIDQGRKIIEGLLPFGRKKYETPSKDQVTLQKGSPQPIKTVEENHQDNAEKTISNTVSTPPDESLPLDPLEHLKQQILMTIEYFNSIHDTMRAIEVVLNKAST